MKLPDILRKLVDAKATITIDRVFLGKERQRPAQGAIHFRHDGIGVSCTIVEQRLALEGSRPVDSPQGQVTCGAFGVGGQGYTTNSSIIPFLKLKVFGCTFGVIVKWTTPGGQEQRLSISKRIYLVEHFLKGLI